MNDRLRNIKNEMVKRFDFLIIGSGIAGMSYALKVADKGKVALICKTTLEEANTYFAQGGVASVTNMLLLSISNSPPLIQFKTPEIHNLRILRLLLSHPR